jgi:heme A synthase
VYVCAVKVSIVVAEISSAKEVLVNVCAGSVTVQVAVGITSVVYGVAGIYTLVSNVDQYSAKSEPV